jgi:Rrf2 family iron-sulfur cluster assembly transcriptional regulator
MISKRARYALHGVGYLAWRADDAPVPFAEIMEYLRDYARGLTLSSGYVAKIFQDLARSGLVHSAVGRRGGYALARDARKVRVVEIVAAVDGMPMEDCCMLSVGGCDNQAECGVHELLNSAQSAFYEFLTDETADSLSRRMFGRRSPGRGRARSQGARRSGAASRRQGARRGARRSSARR